MARISITADVILAYARKLEGKGKPALHTIDEQAGFTFTVRGDTIVYTPESSNTPRDHPKSYLHDVCERFSQTKSLVQSSYDGTQAASYTLPLIVKYLAAVVDGDETP
jgi:hypothetical protein